MTLQVTSLLGRVSSSHPLKNYVEKKDHPENFYTPLGGVLAPMFHLTITSWGKAHLTSVSIMLGPP